MNTKEITYAAQLHFIHEIAHRSADAIDPGRKRKSDLVMHFDRIIKESQDAFFMLTGKFPYQVRAHELNTVSPAEWVKEHKAVVY